MNMYNVQLYNVELEPGSECKGSDGEDRDIENGQM